MDQTETLRAQVKEILKDAVERFPRALVDHHVPFDHVSEPLSYSHNRDHGLLWAHIDHRYPQYNLVDGLTLQMGGTYIPLDELNLLGLNAVVEALPGFLAEVRKREAKIVETYYMGKSYHVSHVVDDPQIFQKATEQLSALKEAMSKESHVTMD